MESSSSTSALGSQPVAAFYAGSRAARWFGRGLRAAHRLSPALGLRMALRLFFTPLPSKLAARARPVPAPWTLQRWPFEGGSMAVWRRGGLAADRPTVLLVHGWAGDAMQLRALGDTLAEAGYAPLLLDFPGHGRSDGWGSTLPQFVRALFAVQARTGPLHAVVAHSLGALASAHAVARGLATGRLVLIAPPTPPAVFIHGFALSFGLGTGLAGRMRRAIQEREGVPLEQFEPAWLTSHTTVPTLIVHDRDDRVAPLATAELLAQALPDAQLHTTEGLGHRRVLADAGVAAAVREHLEDRQIPAGL